MIDLYNSTIRHNVNIQRLAENDSAEMYKAYKEVVKKIIAHLPFVDDMNKRELNALLAELTALQVDFYKQYKETLYTSFSEFMVSEAVFSASLIEKAVKDYQATIPDSKKLLAILRNTPLSIGKNGAGQLLEPFLDNWSKSQINSINGIIRQGWFESAGSRAIIDQVKVVTGNQAKRSISAVVRTATNGLANAATMATWQANKDVVMGWQFVSVLDARTTTECASIDSLNKVYDIGSGPQPPRHINCRSTMVSVVKDSGPIDQLGYYEWLKTQPKDFVFDVLGPTRGELLISGKLSAKKFADLQLNKRFEPITLTEMIEKDKRLNLNLFPKG
jgi:SPP1 gp7 family putative phage head morphogenesis protein